MKKVILAFVFMFPIFTYSRQARISIDTARVVGDIDPKIYAYLSPSQEIPPREG